MKIYSGSSNIPLAKKLSKSMNIPLGEVELNKFTNNECKVWVKDKVPQEVIILQSFSNPVDYHIIEFCLLADALKRQGAEKIIAIVPWLGYSKQDKVFRPGEPLSVKVIAKIIQTTPIKKIITFDLHNPAIMGFFETPLKNINASGLFLDYFKSQLESNDYIMVSPDAGAVKTSTQFANKLNIPIAYLNKKRDLKTGKVIIEGIDRSIKNKDIIILDDMIVTGSTLLSASNYLKRKGAQSITVVATHHLYLNGVQQKLEKAGINTFLITDSIKKPIELSSKNLQIFSINEMIASTFN